MDYNFEVKALPKKGETIPVQGFTTAPGGKGANQAASIARLGGEVLMIGAVGDDDNGRMLKMSMEKMGAYTALKTVTTSTGNAFITIDENGDNTILVYPGANLDLDIAWVEKYKDEIKEAAFVILQLEIPLGTVVDCITSANKLNTKVILNPAPAKKLPDKIFPMIDIITPNETELSALTDIKVRNLDDVRKASFKLLERGVKNIVVTLGKHGCFYKNNKEELFIKSFKVKPIDTTAAGDAFNGALAVTLGEGKPIKDALRFSNAVGALTTTKLGAQRSLPSRQDVQSFISKMSYKEGE